MTPTEVKRTIRELRMVESGEIFETHHVREVLIRAGRLQKKLQVSFETVLNANARAVREFILGWPDATEAPWVIKE